MILQKHNEINVLRDDLLTGGTKSVLMSTILDKDFDEYVYASPVYGGFQIALSAYCNKIGKAATIFCAKRTVMHDNTKRCLDLGATIFQIPYGYMTNLESKAKAYCSQSSKRQKLPFGANTEQAKAILAQRVSDALDQLGHEPDEIWCAVGSGTLIDSILMATSKAICHGVQVGAEYKKTHERLIIHKYHKPFDKPSKAFAPFPSMPNYDLKAWEYCIKMSDNKKNVLFWNVL